MSRETHPAPTFYRLKEGLGLWEHRGKVAAVGIGHSPTMRRWDWQGETSVGAWAILALRKAIEDAGIDPREIDGLAMLEDTSTRVRWPSDREVPADFQRMFRPTDNPDDGLTRLSPEWVLGNMPELSNVTFVTVASDCISNAFAAAIQAVGDGLTKACLVLKGWHNLEGRFGHGGDAALATVEGTNKWVRTMAGSPAFRTALQFQHYLDKYGKSHDMMAPFVVNSRANGLLFPEGYFAQHRPEPITVDDYNNARWVAEPANLLDNDLPIHTAAAYVITSAERAEDLRQRPAYVLGHAGNGQVKKGAWSPARYRGMVETLEEAEDACSASGRKVFEAAGIAPQDLSFENMYDGFTLFHVFHIEGIAYGGIRRGEALDFFQTDISIKGPHPVSPSGGNVGGGRTRYWMHTDAIQQIQGRAGARQISRPADVGISGGPMPGSSNFVVWSATPD